MSELIAKGSAIAWFFACVALAVALLGVTLAYAILLWLSKSFRIDLNLPKINLAR